MPELVSWWSVGPCGLVHATSLVYRMSQLFPSRASRPSIPHFPLSNANISHPLRPLYTCTLNLRILETTREPVPERDLSKKMATDTFGASSALDTTFEPPKVRARPGSPHHKDDSNTIFDQAQTLLGDAESTSLGANARYDSPSYRAHNLRAQHSSQHGKSQGLDAAFPEPGSVKASLDFTHGLVQTEDSQLPKQHTAAENEKTGPLEMKEADEISGVDDRSLGRLPGEQNRFSTPNGFLGPDDSENVNAVLQELRDSWEKTQNPEDIVMADVESVEDCESSTTAC